MYIPNEILDVPSTLKCFIRGWQQWWPVLIAIFFLSNIAPKSELGTPPIAPVIGSMPESVGKSVEKLSNIQSIEVSIVWEPKWHKDLMSDEAKLALDIF